jgi:hypothetical protein
MLVGHPELLNFGVPEKLIDAAMTSVQVLMLPVLVPCQLRGFALGR